MVNAGVVSVGGADATGILAVNGSYTQTKTGVLNLEIGGLTPGAQFDLLQVSGEATLGGTLNIALLGSFSPSDGDAFQVLTFGSRTGTFVAINGLDIGGGLILDPVFSDTTLVLVATTTPLTGMNEKVFDPTRRGHWQHSGSAASAIQRRQGAKKEREEQPAGYPPRSS